MRIHKCLYLIAFVAAPFLYSCGSGDDPKPDYVKESIGTYNVAVILSDVDGTSDVGVGSLKVSKNGDEIILDFTIEGVTFPIEGVTFPLEVVGVEQSSNGYAFNVRTSVLDVDGDSFIIKGINSWKLDDRDYHGGYDKDDERIEICLLFEDLDYPDYNFEFSILAIKQ